MKVVCVDDSFQPVSTNGVAASKCRFPNGWLQHGEIYTVTDASPTSYALEEMPYFGPEGQAGRWVIKRFVPLEYYQAEFQVSNEKEDGVTA